MIPLAKSSEINRFLRDLKKNSTNSDKRPATVISSDTVNIPGVSSEFFDKGGQAIVSVDDRKKEQQSGQQFGQQSGQQSNQNNQFRSKNAGMAPSYPMAVSNPSANTANILERLLGGEVGKFLNQRPQVLDPALIPTNMPNRAQAQNGAGGSTGNVQPNQYATQQAAIPQQPISNQGMAQRAMPSYSPYGQQQQQQQQPLYDQYTGQPLARFAMQPTQQQLAAQQQQQQYMAQQRSIMLNQELMRQQQMNQQQLQQAVPLARSDPYPALQQQQAYPSYNAQAYQRQPQ